MENEGGFSAAKGTALVFGVLAGLGGLTHGIGEVLQGNVRPDGIIIDSWTQGPIATNMGGEPGMTIVPNLLLTGILTLVVSLAVIVCATFVRNSRNGRILFVLSVLMLLVGGGFGPPVLGMLAGVAGIGIDRASTRSRKGGSSGIWRTLGSVWPWIFGVAVVNGVFLVIGSVVLVYAFNLNTPDLFTNSFFFAVLSLAATIFFARAYDVQRTA